MQIFLRGLDGRTTAHEISLRDDVAAIKRGIEQREGLPGNLVRLVYAGRELQDTCAVLPLAQAECDPEPTIQVLLRLRGGMRGARAAARRAAGKTGVQDEQKAKKKIAGLFTSVVDKNVGLELRAEPLDFRGQGDTFKRRRGSFKLVFMFVFEQLRSTRKVLHSAFFFSYLGIFTATVFMTMEGESLYDHHQALVNVLTQREWYYDDAKIKKVMYDVESVTDFWRWLRGPFINEVLPTKEGGVPWDAWQGFDPQRPGNFHTNLWLLVPITLRQLRVRSDSCDVSKAKNIARGRTELDYRFSATYAEQNNLYSQKLALDAYVSQCKIVDYEPPPAGCGDIQNGAGDWSARSPRGQVGLVPGCYADFSAKAEARDPYGPIDPQTNMSMWTWKSAKELQANSWVGRSNVLYPGSGYSVTIPTDPERASETIKFLDVNQWLDLATRAVFIDLLVYNPNHGYLSLVKLSFEFRPAQETIIFATWKHMGVWQAFWNQESVLQMRFELVIFVMVIFFCFKELYVLKKMKRTYFYHGWHYIAVVNYWLYMISFAFRVSTFVEIERLGLPPPAGVHANYESAFQAGQNWKYCMAINCVIVWLRCFEHLRAFPFMGYLVRVLARALSPILVVCISFSIVTYSFAMAYVLAFSGGIHNYRTLSWTITTLQQELMGLDDFEELWEENRLLGPVYYISWTLVGAFIFVSLFVVVLLTEAGDISRQFNLDGLIKRVAKTVKNMKLTKKDESRLFQGGEDDALRGIEAELAQAVKRQAEKEGQSFFYGKKQKAKTSLEAMIELIDKAAKTADQDYCNVTKEELSKLEGIVQRVSDVVDVFNDQNRRHTAASEYRPKTNFTAASATVRSLTGNSRASSVDIRKLREHLVSRGSYLEGRPY